MRPIKYWANIKMAVLLTFVLFLISFVSLTGCSAEKPTSIVKDKFRNVYEVFVGSFYDSDGDGMGDLRGLTEKLAYICDPDTGLGADAIWMMPIMPSPSYHKYDVTDYHAIDPAYGTMEDFDALIEACNERGVMLIIDLVLNHTSTEHPWFQEALAEIREKKELHYFNYYNFMPNKPSSDYYTAEGYFYEAVFWSGMPDLNFDNADVRDEFKEIVTFWLDKGVAGFRLDAAKHVYHTQKENIAFWNWFTGICREINPEVYLVAEVWDTDAVMVPYYQTGLDTLFNFGFAGSTGVIADCIKRENGRDLATRIENYDIVIKKQYEDAINGLFLSNHDTDRSSAFFDEAEEKMKLAAAIYMLIPGNPYIYYGEEIGMTGKGRDENKRAPMVWSVTDTTGQTLGPLDMTERPSLTEGVAEQWARNDSLLNRYRDLFQIKNKYPAIARGIPKSVKASANPSDSAGEKNICAYEIEYEATRLMIVHNLSAETRTAVFSNDGISKAKLAETLTNGETCSWDKAGGVLTIPGYATAVLVWP